MELDLDAKTGRSLPECPNERRQRIGPFRSEHCSDETPVLAVAARQHHRPAGRARLFVPPWPVDAVLCVLLAPLKGFEPFGPKGEEKRLYPHAIVDPLHV